MMTCGFRRLVLPLLLGLSACQTGTTSLAAYAAKSETLSLAGLHQEARRALEEGISAVETPEEEALLGARIVASYLAERRLEDAIEWAERLTRYHPASFGAWQASTLVWLRKGHLAKAEQALRAARHQAGPGELQWVEAMAKILACVRLFADGQLEQAATGLDQVRHPAFGPIRAYLRGRIAVALGRLQDLTMRALREGTRAGRRTLLAQEEAGAPGQHGNDGAVDSAAVSRFMTPQSSFAGRLIPNLGIPALALLHELPLSQTLFDHKDPR